MKRTNLIIVALLTGLLSLSGCGRQSTTTIEVGGGEVVVSQDSEVIYDSTTEAISELTIETETIEEIEETFELEEVSGLLCATFDVVGDEVRVNVFTIDPTNGNTKYLNYNVSFNVVEYEFYDIGRFGNGQELFSSDGSKMIISKHDRQTGAIYAGYFDLTTGEFVNVSEMLGLHQDTFSSTNAYYATWIDSNDNFGFVASERGYLGDYYSVPLDNITSDAITTEIEWPTGKTPAPSGEFKEEYNDQVTDISSSFYITDSSAFRESTVTSVIVNDGNVIEYIPNTNGRNNFSGVASQDEEWIAFMSMRPDLVAEIYVTMPDGGEPIRVDYYVDTRDYLVGYTKNINRSRFYLLDWK